MSTALVFGCSDGGDANTGGSAGDRGSGGGGGTTGAEAGPKSATYLLLSPILPCAEGIPSDYLVEILGDAITTLTATFPDCSDLADAEQDTITCSNENGGTDYTIRMNEGSVPDTSLVVSGTFETCAGGLLWQFEEVSAGGEMLVDFYVRPELPCEEGMPSDYSVDVFVDGRPGPPPAGATARFGECTGTIDSEINTITCPNDMESSDYMVTVREGSDTQVTVYGNWETCGTLFLQDSL
jgi:hypothetical protein